MKFSPYVIDLLKQKSKKDFRLSGDCEYLALDIESVTGEHIGVNTLKRLLGFIDDEREPRPSTLDIIEDEIRVSDLATGQHIQISYLPDRLIELEYCGDEQFVVKESQNSKLQIDDKLAISHIVKGYPLLVSHVWRDGADLGSFTAGKAQGISFKIV